MTCVFSRRERRVAAFSRLCPATCLRPRAQQRETTEMAEDKPSALQSQVETMASAADRAELFQLDDFKRDFQQILTLLLAAKPSDIQNLLVRADFDDSATKWATDPNATVVYVVKSVDRQPDDDDQHDQNSPYDVSYSYALTLTLSYDPSQAATLAFIKHVPVINSSLPLASQLHFLNLFGPAADGPSSGLRAQNASSKTTSGVYEGLHKLVHWGVAPAFDAFVEGKTRKDASNAVAPARRRADDSKDAEAKTGIPVAKKKFAELELSLLHRTSFKLTRDLRSQLTTGCSATECRNS